MYSQNAPKEGSRVQEHKSAAGLLDLETPQH